MAVPERCKLVNKNGLLLLAMPDGTIIPGQGEITISQDIDYGKVKACKVVVEFVFVEVEHENDIKNEYLKIQIKRNQALKNYLDRSI